MGIFSSIKDAIFGKSKVMNVTQAAVQATAAVVTEQASQPAPEIVDIDAVLTALSAEQGGTLNYRTSVVDMMKLVGIESSYANRSELAAELGIAGYEGTADQNIALHKAVLRELANNGGKVPADLLD